MLYNVRSEYHKKANARQPDLLILSALSECCYPDICSLSTNSEKTLPEKSCDIILWRPHRLLSLSP